MVRAKASNHRNPNEIRFDPGRAGHDHIGVEEIVMTNGPGKVGAYGGSARQE
jgi:hypothetical protein